MCSAAVFSGLFLVFYVIHYVWRVSVAGGTHTPYHGVEWMVKLYYGVLISHILLAVTVPVFAIRLIRLGLTGQIDKHRRLARIGFPIWVYVSITGVLIYFMLFWYNDKP